MTTFVGGIFGTPVNARANMPRARAINQHAALQLVIQMSRVRSRSAIMKVTCTDDASASEIDLRELLNIERSTVNQYFLTRIPGASSGQNRSAEVWYLQDTETLLHLQD